MSFGLSSPLPLLSWLATCHIVKHSWPVALCNVRPVNCFMLTNAIPQYFGRCSPEQSSRPNSRLGAELNLLSWNLDIHLTLAENVATVESLLFGESPESKRDSEASQNATLCQERPRLWTRSQARIIPCRVSRHKVELDGCPENRWLSVQLRSLYLTGCFPVLLLLGSLIDLRRVIISTSQVQAMRVLRASVESTSSTCPYPTRNIFYRIS